MLVLVCAVLLGACREQATASGTSLYIITEFTPTLQLTQMRVWGSVEGGAAFGPHLLPEQETRLLQSGETLRILLEGAPDGVPAKVYVEGLSNGETVARGEGTTRIRDGYEVEITLRLEAAPPDGGDGGTGNPDGGTFCAGCDGCCVQGFCTHPTFQTCGVGGISCVACDDARANACDPRGVCVCGPQPACNGLNVDRCVNGQCKCGAGGPCGAGQECVNGACRCTPSSCSGCCWGDFCAPGNVQNKCGKGGEACRRCNKNCSADRTCS